eukprot:1196226-Prorocentrum_minimum.AAC.3
MGAYSTIPYIFTRYITTSLMCTVGEDAQGHYSAPKTDRKSGRTVLRKGKGTCRLYTRYTGYHHVTREEKRNYNQLTTHIPPPLPTQQLSSSCNHKYHRPNPSTRPQASRHTTLPRGHCGRTPPAATTNRQLRRRRRRRRHVRAACESGSGRAPRRAPRSLPCGGGPCADLSPHGQSSQSRAGNPARVVATSMRAAPLARHDPRGRR